MVAIGEKWTLGFKDRGMGHGDFGVITASGELVVECSSRDLAEHIVEIHNKWLKSKKGKV